MADRRLSAVLALMIGCAPPATPGHDAATPDADEDPEPTFTDEERRLLEGLRYDETSPPADPSNRYGDDPAARAFGHRLFFETTLSGPLIDGDNDGSIATLGVVGEAGRVSCAGCHVPDADFVDTRSNHRQISLGAQWTRRRSPTLLEVAFAPLYNWDGRRDSLWAQAIGVMESDVEFNSARLFVAQEIFRAHRAEYEAIFGTMPALDDEERFPPLAAEDAGCDFTSTPSGPVRSCRGLPGDGAAYDAMGVTEQDLVTEVTVNVAKAIAAYLRVLRCGPSRFDMWLDGEPGALSRSEQRGAALFVGRAGCVSCHDGPLLTDHRFHNVGLRPLPVAVAFTALDDRGAGEALPLLMDDPLNADGAFSDGARGPLPAIGPELEGAFRTPTLRCVPGQPSFMHTAQHRSLAEVVAFFARGGDRYAYPGTSELTPLDLSPREQADLVAFLGTLEGAGPEAIWLEAP